MRDDGSRLTPRQVLPDRDEALFAVAAERARAADLLHPVERGDVERQLESSGPWSRPVRMSAQLLAGVRVGGEQLVLDEDVHGLAVGRGDRTAGEAGRRLAEPRSATCGAWPRAPNA